MSDQASAIKKELSRVRDQKRSAYTALVKIAHDNGFFNPEWGQSAEEWLDAPEDTFGLHDEHGRPSYCSIQVEDTAESRNRQEAVSWAQWWVKFKEWDLLGQSGTPYPAKIQKLYEKFLSADSEVKELAKELGGSRFTKKHPGFFVENLLPRFPDEVILACWADEA